MRKRRENPLFSLDKRRGKNSSGVFLQYLSIPLVLLLCFALTVLLIYVGSRPKTYHLNISDASPYDIEAPRSIVNAAETQRRAAEAMAQVGNKMSRSDDITRRSLENTETFLRLASDRRSQLYKLNTEAEDKEGHSAAVYHPTPLELTESTTALLTELKQVIEFDFDPAYAKEIMGMTSSRFQALSNNIRSSAELVMSESVDEIALPKTLQSRMDILNQTELSYAGDLGIVDMVLRSLLRPNVIFNAEATENARQDAYNRVQQNPIMINRGTRIVSEGDIITEDTYKILQDLNLIDAGGVDWQALVGQGILVLLLMFLLSAYLHHYKRELLGITRESMALIMSLMIPLVVSASLGQIYQLAPPVYFTAVVISAYFGFETSLVFSASLVIAVMPMVNFNPSFLVIALAGSIVAALFTQGISTQDNFAKLILATALSNVLSSGACALMQRNNWAEIGSDISVSVISGVASVIAAIGLMPLFEMVFNTVSPIRLIELSQPGHPLMRRLFLEAPGTSQHSMMVANLADTAAEAIGANAMICRVGAYYHDIGKLENPIMFTENQMDYNPHDYMRPSESAAIITRHPEDGVKIGRKSRLPLPVLNIIEEHHGSTVLQYFYRKACEAAKRDGLPEPDAESFKYRTPLPSSKESAIVMLADSTEAAVKSSEADSIETAKTVMQNVFKIKNEQNQLNQSGLSYAEVERIMKSFLQVYSGHFHERVKYQDAISETRTRQQAEKI